ncbi:MAG: 2-amino-4-hydroxy-6-hydroxymethyldihydropteridine diphosphokinase [Candidatus Limimorpha sp.]
MENVYILLGSNLGDRENNILEACGKISERCGKIVEKSPVYESEPWGFDAEQWFLNQVIKIETALSPDGLMRELLSIELSLGRDRVTPHKGFVSRPIDLDILYYGNYIVDTELVTAPHPRLHLRRFTLLPLCDIAPDFVNLKLNMSNTQLLEACDDNGKVNRFKV